MARAIVGGGIGRPAELLCANFSRDPPEVDVIARQGPG
jgi:hypothetical protein